MRPLLLALLALVSPACLLDGEPVAPQDSPILVEIGGVQLSTTVLALTVDAGPVEGRVFTNRPLGPLDYVDVAFPPYANLPEVLSFERLDQQGRFRLRPGCAGVGRLNLTLNRGFGALDVVVTDPAREQLGFSVAGPGLGMGGVITRGGRLQVHRTGQGYWEVFVSMALVSSCGGALASRPTGGDAALTVVSADPGIQVQATGGPVRVFSEQAGSVELKANTATLGASLVVELIP